MRKRERISQQQLRPTVAARLAAVLVGVSSTAVFPGLANAERFSIECTWIRPYHVTFDTTLKRTVLETAEGMTLKGTIAEASAQAIRFDLLRAGDKPFDLVWREQSRELTWIGAPFDLVRGTNVSACQRVPLRTILSEYEQIPPFK